MFPNHREKFSSDAFEIANCKNTLEIFTKLGINKSDMPDKWFRFFSASLQRCPENRFSLKDLMQILQIGEPFEYELNEPISIFLR